MKLIPLQGRGNEYLFRPNGSEIIWVSRYKKGFGRKQQSLGTKNNIEAREKRDDLFSDWLGEKPSDKISRKVKLFPKDLWPEWESTKKRKSQATRDSIRFSGKHLLPHIENMDPDEITETWWENTYIPAKRAETHELRKFFSDWKWLTSFLKYLHREGRLKRYPKLENPDPPTDAGLNLSDEEMQALYDHASQDLKLQIDLGFKHFMRRSEVLLLPYSEINYKEGFIDLPAIRTKIRNGRQIPLNDATIDKLRVRQADSKSPYVFPSPVDKNRPIRRQGNQTAWQSALLRANEKEIQINPDATFHDLRHSGLTRAFAATNRYAEICVVAGLSLAEAQRTYLHFKPNQLKFVSSLVSQKSGVMNAIHAQ